MKTWMKILMWLGLGGGIGFFAGYKAGSAEKGKAERAAYEMGRSDGFYDCATGGDVRDEVEQALKEYSGIDGDTDGDHVTGLVDDYVAAVGAAQRLEDDAETEDIPELHQQHLIPEQISEEEYYENKWGYDQEELVYYEDDKVLYDTATRKALKTQDDIDQVIGIGMLYCFRLKDGEELDAIFVRNDTMGVIFRIDRVEASYEDEISGADAPDYEEDEDFTEEDPE